MSSYATPARSDGSNSTSRTPPSQIFTRGSVGAVKTVKTVPRPARSTTGLVSVASNASSSDKRLQTRDEQSRGRKASRNQHRSRSLSRTKLGSNSGELATLTSSPPPTSSKRRESSPAPSNDTNGSSRRRRHLRKTKTIMDELTRATPERRIACITNACETLDHSDTQSHDEELSIGVATVLVNQLSTTKKEEIRMLVAALEMVLRGSTPCVQTAREAWPDTVIPRLLQLVESHETTRIAHHEITTANLFKILVSLAKVVSLKATLLRTPGMTQVLLRLNKSQHKLIRLKLLHCLCQDESNQVQILNHKPLMELVLHVAHHDNNACRQYAASILMELASSSTINQANMAHDDKILGTLVKMVLTDNHPGTRESVLTALQNLAFVHNNRTHLVTFKNGIVLEALRNALSSDSTKAGRRAAGALTNLACDGTAVAMGNYKGLLDALAVAATNGVDEVQARASLALTKIAGSITVNTPCFHSVLDALVVASLSSALGNVAAILRLKSSQPENRHEMANHAGLLDTLADLCHGPHRDHAVRALMHLANDVKNQELIGHSRIVLDALVMAASGEDSSNDARDCAILALERLAVCQHLRSHLARHPGLITVVAKAVEREANLQSHGQNDPNRHFLAKPLLMSLLVAMQ